MKIGIVIPAHDEAGSVGQVVGRCQRAVEGLGSHRIVVCDNDSRDQTAQQARRAGAEVVFASPRGYGRACLAAIAWLGSWPDVLVFVDADGSCRPEQMGRLLVPLRTGETDLVIGYRPAGSTMTPPQRWGNRIATALIAWRWGCNFRDLGPFRAIRRSAYQRLGMSDRTWGWTVEMQVLAFLRGLRVMEVPVSWDPRQAGSSKISGTALGVLRAGSRILWTLFGLSVRSVSRRPGLFAWGLSHTHSDRPVR